MDFRFTGVKILICLAVLLVASGKMSDSNARLVYLSVETPITDTQYKRFHNILNCLGNAINLENLTTDCSKGKIELKNIKTRITKTYSVIRIEDETYCVDGLCLGYVVMNCNLDSCPYASAMISEKYFHPDNLNAWNYGKKLGSSLALVFDGGGRKQTVFLIGLTHGFVSVVVSSGMPRG